MGLTNLRCLKEYKVAPLINPPTHHPPRISSIGLSPRHPLPPQRQYKPFIQFIKPFIQASHDKLFLSVFVCLFVCFTSTVHLLLLKWLPHVFHSNYLWGKSALGQVNHAVGRLFNNKSMNCETNAHRHLPLKS